MASRRYPAVLQMQFKLYVGGHRKSDFYNVMIFQAKEFMWKFWEGQIVLQPSILPSHGSKKLDFLALATHWTTVNVLENEEIILPHCGQILFCKEAVNAEIVSHEMTHAALYWHTENTTRFNPMKNRTHDEALASTQGKLVNEFWRQWYARKDKDN